MDHQVRFLTQGIVQEVKPPWSNLQIEIKIAKLKLAYRKEHGSAARTA